ncbi:hypothetical protein L0F63_003669 [Massospora cicadina]|nr:hypothetical protein L0F63_003669 [Massospora cicadina]
MRYHNLKFDSVTEALNIASLCSAVVALLLFSTCCILKPAFANRVSLRLQAGISLCDVVLHFLLLQFSRRFNGALCSLFGFSHVVFRQWYCFLNIAIGINLQLIFIHELNPKPQWEVMYWVFPVIVSFLLNVPPLVMNEFGRDDDLGYCFFKEKDRSNLFVIFNVAAILVPAFVYCTTISIVVILRIREDWASVAASTFHQVNPSRAQLKVLEERMKRLVIRIALYPGVALITLSGYAVNYTVFLITGEIPELVWYWSATGQVLSGFFNLVAFCFDPSFHYCVISIWADVRRCLKTPENISNPPRGTRGGTAAGVFLELNDVISNTPADPYASDDEYRFVILDDAECRAAMNLF